MADRHISPVSAMLDQPSYIGIRASVKLNLDSIRIAGQEGVLEIVKMAVQTDNIDSQLMENGQIRAGWYLLPPQIQAHGPFS